MQNVKMEFYKKYKSFTIFYSFVFLANITFFTVLTEYRMVSKPMIMASLIGFYISTVSKQSNGFIMAMIFALFGDIFLMMKGEDFFLLGLGSFLLMQVFYAAEFYQDRTTDRKTIIIKSLPVMIITCSTMMFLWDKLGEMRWPVFIYALAISTMIITALIRKPQIRWYLPVVVGVILFMLSDIALAVSKFDQMTDLSIQYFVMATYMIAQYLIVRGKVEQSNSQ
jgi:uncharacterized membrane protein YhhN